MSSFSHSDYHGSNSSGGNARYVKITKTFESRITKLNAKISCHIEEMDKRDMEIVSLKKVILDLEERCKDYRIEVTRLTEKVTYHEQLEADDADEDEAREKKLRKTRHHLKELDEKYHALLKKF